MKGKIIFSFLILSLLIYEMLYPQSKESALDYFKSIRDFSISLLPDEFTAILSGENIQKKLATIPKDSYLNPNKKVEVEIKYTKKDGLGITVLNVDDLYKDLYRDLPRQLFAFELVLSRSSNDSFLNKYQISYHLNQTDLAILKLQVKGAENNILIYVNKEKKQLQRIDYLLGAKIQSSTIVGYKEVQDKDKTFSIPQRFITKIFGQNDKSTRDIIELMNIEVKK